MRQILLVVVGVVAAVTIIISISALNQANQEQIELTSRLQSRSQLLADSLAEGVQTSFNSRATSSIQRIVNRFASSERLVGIGVFDVNGDSIASSSDLIVPLKTDLVLAAMDKDEPQGEFVRRDGASFYVNAVPLHDGDSVVGALAVIQNATYIDESIRDIWRSNLIRFLMQLFVFVTAILVLVRLVFFRSISKMTEAVQAVRKGEINGEMVPSHGFFAPLAGELSKMTQSLRQARHAASEEARMRLEQIDSPWTADRLKEFIKVSLKGRPIFVISNREPYVHSHSKKGIEWTVPAGGLVTALEPVMEACGGTWIAHGSGNADLETVDKDDKLQVPPDEPQYTLKRVWLNEKELSGYYNGFSNEALWPLCLMAHTRPLFRAEDWTEYERVNAKFANALLDEIRDAERPIVLVQDYHLALVPEMVKKHRPDANVAIFWHIPWPSAAQFNICPWRKELLKGMLGADLVGFHTQQYCNNFIDTVSNEIEARVDLEQFAVFHQSHQTFVKPFPISIAFPGSAEGVGDPDTNLLKTLGIDSKFIVLGVDRLDYSKGILERFKGIEFLLDTHPEYRGGVVLLQIASPSRESIERYREYSAQITMEAERINAKYRVGDWRPIVLEKRYYNHRQLANLYRLANVCLITSLHDGMNLVAKEFAAARADESGVLVLSQFTGAARDLKGAILINPYSAEETSEALHKALTMPEVEQRYRMKTMRDSVRDYNIYRWSAELMKMLSRMD